jgi:hypothetical protein
MIRIKLSGKNLLIALNRSTNIRDTKPIIHFYGRYIFAY